MLKIFLHFNRGQKIGIIILLGLIVISLLAGWLMPRLVKPQLEVSDASFLKESA